MITQQTAAFVDKDVTNCYDLILMNVSEISTRRLGLTSETAKFQTNVLKNMQHHINV